MKTVREKIRVVSIDDKPYSFSEDEFLDQDTQTCSKGLECMVPRYTTNYTIYYKSCCIGFILDIFQLIIKEVVIPFEIYFVEDRKYGVFKKGQWNGMMGDLVSGKADMVMAGLTITKGRIEAADFTTPYMFDQMGIITKPQPVVANFFNWSFIDPLGTDLQLALWLLISFAMLLLYLLENTIYFYNYRRFHHLVESTPYYCFLEGMTHISGVTLQRDLGGKHPERPGARIFSLTYAIAMVIIVSTYTAVLAAQSMKNEEKEPFQGSNDPRVCPLIRQSSTDV